MKAIIGVGNPGREYDKTRHNAGFRVLDGLAGRLRARGDGPGEWKSSRGLEALAAERKKEFILIKPEVFVNRTGRSAQAFLERHQGCGPGDLLVVCDDVNLDLGKLRLRPGGSDGGHHGLLSVIEALGSGDFPRLRVGIRTAGMPGELSPYVLGKFLPEEEEVLRPALDRAVLVCEAWLKEGFEAALGALARSNNEKTGTKKDTAGKERKNEKKETVENG